ncbi:SGNH/GDSL hydrolase family protein [Candidatus Kaiserbacteria bacterium]|nr:SGNH/GDSL hydrolase family protein [Candidatus Kaiserbacteria bacterium]
MNSTDPKRLPQWLLWGILAGLLLVISVGGAELVLRLVPGPWTSSFFYIYDPVVGTWHLSSFTGDNLGIDYKIRGVRFNEFGMRDRDRSFEKNLGVTRIAFLGDSFIEGAQVGNEEVVTRRMETQLGPKVEVLNFGVSGFGTYQALLTYEERVRPFKPDIVILGFYTGNDMRNNLRAVESLYGDASSRPFLEKRDDGSWAAIPASSKDMSRNAIVLFLKRHFALYRFLWFEKQRFSGMWRLAEPPENSAPSTQSVESMDAYIARLFAPPKDQPFLGAWEATEYLIERLKDAVERDGGRFVLVAIPDPVVFEADPRASLEKLYNAPLPEEYDPEYPQKRLARMAGEAGISYVDLTPAFKSYRDAHALPFPYFAFEHDGHWSALGHAVAADTITAHLRDAELKYAPD